MGFKEFQEMYNLYQQYQQYQQAAYQQVPPTHQYQQAPYQQVPPTHQYQQAVDQQVPPTHQYQQAVDNNAAIDALSRQINDMSMRLTSLTLAQNQPATMSDEDMVIGFFDSVINPGGDPGKK